MKHCKDNNIPLCYYCRDADSANNGGRCMIITYKELLSDEIYVEYFINIKSSHLDKALELFPDEGFAPKIRLSRLLR